VLSGHFTSPGHPLDVDGDGTVSPADAVYVINELNALGPRTLTSTDRSLEGPFLDTSGDRFVTPLDALLVINFLNAGGQNEAPAAAAPRTADSHDLALLYYALGDEDADDDESLEALASAERNVFR